MALNSLHQFDNIVKPREDKRNYLGLKLSNDLDVLLISDPETDISAASLSVHVGSMSDPWEIQGLAHFLEHMLFMGTKKYPTENEYSKFLSQHGGNSNAYTDSNITNFFFDVAPEYLEPSLDRFAQFFIEPLMLESSVSRELEAVNSEFQKNLMNDSWRINQIKHELGSPKHDYYKFNIGNYETLRDSPYLKQVNIRDELIKFHNQWYSANTMRLCVYGKESLDDLTKMVEPLFSKIQNKNIVCPNWENPYNPQNLMKQAIVVPIKDKRNLEFIFVYPDEKKHYKSSPGMYLSHLIGHESKGSLLSELKKRGLSSSLYSYNDILDGFGFFSISVDLTEEAMNRIDEIIVLVFQYINMLKKHGPKQYVFDEMKGINYIKFHFMEKCNPIDYVLKLSNAMHYYPMDDVLSAYYLLDEFKPDLITKHLDYLKLENCNIVISSKSFEGKTDQKEKYFGTDFKVTNFSPDLISKIENCGLNDNLHFPSPNEFIPTEFDILPCDEQKNLNLPTLLENSEHLKIWHLQDQVYIKPKVFFGLKFINPMVYSNPYNVNINSLFAMLFKDALTELSYDAEMAGLSYTFRSAVYGFDMEFTGYNHKMHIFFQRIIEHLVDFKVCPKRFEILKEKYGRDLRNYKTQPLYFLTSYYLKSLTSDQFWSYDDLIEALDRMDVESVQMLINSIFINLSIEALFHGNINKEQVQNIIGIIRKNLLDRFKTIPLRKCHQIRPREVILEPGCSYSFEVINDIQKPKAINCYYQVSFDDLEDTSKLLLIGQILNEPFFDYLRTKEQLGYVVYTKCREYGGVHGFNFVIQSDYDVSYLEDRVEAFIAWAKEHFEKINDDEFDSEKKSLITRLLKKKKRLYEYSNELWNEIGKKEYHFKKNEKYAELVKELNKEEISAFFNKHFTIDSPNRKKIIVKIIKSDKSDNKTLPPSASNSDLLPCPSKKPSILIEDVAEFTNYKSLHPIPKPKIIL